MTWHHADMKDKSSGLEESGAVRLKRTRNDIPLRGVLYCLAESAWNMFTLFWTQHQISRARKGRVSHPMSRAGREGERLERGEDKAASRPSAHGPDGISATIRAGSGRWGRPRASRAAVRPCLILALVIQNTLVALMRGASSLRLLNRSRDVSLHWLLSRCSPTALADGFLSCNA
ncbi:unnamed protein product [Diplocarpon coronariae]